MVQQTVEGFLNSDRELEIREEEEGRVRWYRGK